MKCCKKLKFFLSKSLKTEYAIKPRDLLRFYSNFDKRTILIVKIYCKSHISKIFKFGPPKKKNFKFSLISPISGKKFPNRNLSIFFHTWNLVTFKIYICDTFWQNFMVVGSCVQYLWPFWNGIFTENLSFLVKTHKDGICSKIKNLTLFSLKFLHNTHITNTNIKKNKILENFKFWPPWRIPDFPDFLNSGPKFNDREFIMVL